MKKSTIEKLDAQQMLDYIASCKGRLAGGQRLGQALFNNLYSFNPELANSIRGTDADPFHKDSIIPDFFQAIATEAGYVNVPKAFKK